jgi:hypothetical protein
MNMRDYPTLHGIVSHVHLHPYPFLLYFNLCLSVMLDSLSCSFTSINMRDYPTLHVDINSSKLRKDMDLNEQERLSNITLKTQIKIRKPYPFLLYCNLCLSVMLDSLSCSFTSISFLTLL